MLSTICQFSLPCTFSPHFSVVRVVAPLAQCCKVKKATILWSVVIYMRRGQNYFTPSYWVRFTIYCTTPFTFILSAVMPYKAAYQLPVFRVSSPHFRSNRHSSSNPSLVWELLRNPHNLYVIPKSQSHHENHPSWKRWSG
jgi:hypothetical protein